MARTDASPQYASVPVVSAFGGAGRAANGSYAARQSIGSRNLFGDDVLECLVEDGFPLP